MRASSRGFDANEVTVQTGSVGTPATFWAPGGQSRPIDGVLFDPLETEQLRQRVFASLFEAREPVRFGRYHLMGRIGAGTMGIVYAAYDEQLDRKVALKLVPASLAGSGEAQRRMLREAKALARLSHPHVVQVHDAGTWEGRMFVAMEFVRGRTLRGWLADGEPDWRRIVDRFVEAGRGLAAAHAVGIVHRDFKPDNVLVGEDGRVRVVDFGLAVAGARPREIPADAFVQPLDGSVTATGVVAGTPAYMAPEQLSGDSPDHRADQFSFAVALYEALFGQRPFTGQTIEELLASIEARRSFDVPTTSRVPRSTVAALQRATDPHPDNRFASMDALLDAIAPRPARRGVWPGALALSALAVSGVWLGTRPAEPLVRDLAAQSQAALQQARADIAEETLTQERVETIVRRAREQLDHDPTATLALLRQLPADAWTDDRAVIADLAIAEGVAKTVVAMSDERGILGVVGDDLLVVDDQGVARLDPRTGERQLLEDATSVAKSVKTRIARAVGEHIYIWTEADGALRVVDPDGASRPLGSLRNATVLASGAAGRVLLAADDDGVHRFGPDGPLGPPIGLPGFDPSGSLAVGPSATRIAYVDGDERLVVHDFDRPARIATGHYRGQLDISADGHTIAAIDDRGAVMVWNLDERAPTRLAGTGSFERPTVAPDGRWVVAARTDPDPRRDCHAVLWDLPSGKRQDVCGDLLATARFEASPSGDAILGSDGKHVTLFSATGEPTKRLQPEPSVRFAGFLDESTVVTVGGTSRVRLGGSASMTVGMLVRSWDIRDAVRPELSAPAGEDVVALGYAGPDRILTLTEGKRATLWDLDDHTAMPLPVILESDAFGTAPSGHVAVATRGEVQVFDRDASEVARFPVGNSVRTVGLSGDATSALWIDHDGRLHSRQLRDGTERIADDFCEGCPESFYGSASIQPLTGSEQVALSNGRMLLVIDLATGRAESHDTKSAFPSPISPGAEFSVSLDFTHMELAFPVSVTNLATGEQSRIARDRDDLPESVALSGARWMGINADGVVAFRNDSAILGWESQSDRVFVVAPTGPGTRYAWAFALSPDGDEVAFTVAGGVRLAPFVAPPLHEVQDRIAAATTATVDLQER